ncbi:MAG: hypothetical protein ABH951_02225 [Patescibacteria group bacterium]
MKNFLFLLIIIVLSTLVIVSCKKEPKYEKCFEVPESKVLSIPTDTLLGKTVEVEWSTSDGRGDFFSSTISRVKYLGDSIPDLIISKDAQLTVGIILTRKVSGRKTEVFALKPFISGEGQVWNEMSYAEVGVSETDESIIITSNGMRSPSGEDFMCMRLKIFL